VRRAPAVLLVALASAAAGCGGSSGSATTATSSAGAGTTASTATDTTTTASASGCTTVTPKKVTKPSYKKPQKVLRKAQPASVVMDTNCGTITIVLDPKRGGPIPNSIAFLATKRFFDGLTFHRVVPDFVLQGGDPTGTGSGGPGYSVVGPVPSGYRYRLGDVAMAKTGAEPPGTAGSQFFVISGPSGVGLPTDYGVVGHAADAASLATIARINALGTGDGPPSSPVVIARARLHRG
jgi:cyclophilin family peptidyl-prolyl cis-trans isomerase